jgi:thiol-disulfide isomerase/thioredoxin
LLATPAELKSLGLETTRVEELTAKAEAAPLDFAKLAKQKKTLTPAAKWVHFGGGRPGAVPGPGDGAGDLVVYENVSAMVDTAGKSDQVEIGTLVRIGDTWRLLDVPREISDAPTVTIYKTPDQRDAMQLAGNQPNEAMLENLKKLEEIDKKISEAANPQQSAKLNADRADLVETLAKGADNATDKSMWYRDLGDTVLAAIQMGGFPDGLNRLKKAAQDMANEPDGKDTAASLNYRIIKAEYFLAQQDGNNFAKMQDDWLSNLEKFVSDFPEAEDTPEAMMELATANEFAGNDTKAVKWWAEIVTKFPTSSVGATAKGAQRRLESVGKPLVLQGRKFSGTPGVASLANYKNKVVLVHYWSSEMDLCRSELPQLKNLLAKYGGKFAIFSISLDRDPAALKEFLTTEKLPWEVVYEPGGISSRLATEMGIYTMPTMLLVDTQGRVINRGIHTAELEGELRKLLTPRQASR